MILEYKEHKVFSEITLVYRGDTLLGDVDGGFFHPTYDYRRLSQDEQDEVYNTMTKDGVM